MQKRVPVGELKFGSLPFDPDELFVKREAR